jgi:hypothetical protein
MPRPFTDIQASISGNAVKNGSLVMGATFTASFAKTSPGPDTVGSYLLGYQSTIKNTPTITTIASKYGNRFYNGIFVRQLT